VGINLTACIRLCALFAPKFLRRKEAAIVNISSGLAFVPIAAMPVYCATKAAIHSFTTSLRHQLRGSSVRVFEAVPPTTDTELDASFAGEGEEAYRGISPSEVATAIAKGVESDQEQILVGQAEWLYGESLRDPTAAFQRLNG
jgi:uncharacterized oxidoreductase